MAHQKDSGVTKLLVIEVSFITGISNSWYVNFGITNHFCNMLHGFYKTMKLSDGEVTFHLGSEAIVTEVPVGVVELFFFLNKILVLFDCLFVPSNKTNLISVFSFVPFNLKWIFICLGKLIDGLYLITPKMYEIFKTELNNKSRNLPH